MNSTAPKNCMLHLLSCIGEMTCIEAKNWQKTSTFAISIPKKKGLTQQKMLKAKILIKTVIFYACSQLHLSVT